MTNNNEPATWRINFEELVRREGLIEVAARTHREAKKRARDYFYTGENAVVVDSEEGTESVDLFHAERCVE